MSFFSRLKLWQKGLISGLLFTLFIDIIYTIVLIVFDLVLQTKGLPHTCYVFTKTTQCSFPDALLSRLGFSVVFFLLFGPLLAAIGALLGYLISKVRIQP